jgi:hypothetical protein
MLQYKELRFVQSLCGAYAIVVSCKVMLSVESKMKKSGIASGLTIIDEAIY